jgi:hypothetical protein
MIPTSQVSAPTTDMEAFSWCWSHLGSGGEGILSYDTSQGRLSFTVPYIVASRQITIPLTSFDETVWQSDSAQTSLEVSGRTSNDLRWVIRVTGTAERGEPTNMPGLGLLDRVPRVGHVCSDRVDLSDRLHLRTHRVRGFFKASAAA